MIGTQEIFGWNLMVYGGKAAMRALNIKNIDGTSRRLN